METSTFQPTESANPAKNIIITILLILLVFSLLGINILNIFGNLFQKIIDIFNPVVSKALADLGYSSGNVIGETSDLVADVSKQGIDVLNGTLHSVGDLLIKASDETGKRNSLDNTIQQNRRDNQPLKIARDEPSPNTTTNPIQSPSSNAKYKWCLVGEYNGGRGCVSISDSDKCMSGQIYPSKAVCWNPTISK